MTAQEYKQKLEDLNDQYKKDKEKIMKEYALSNNPYKVGDIIRDHMITGRILKISCYVGWHEYPSCRYLCELLKKDGTPRKKYEEVEIYQNNIK